MNRENFQKWLIDIKKNDIRTSNSRISNCQRIERFCGDLDTIYSQDKGKSLIDKLNYTVEDQRKGNKPKHNIPIDGDVYTGTSTLKSALKLYMEFKDYILIQDSKINNRNNNMNIWKISHGNDGSFDAGEKELYYEKNIVTVNRNTGRGQGNEFENGVKIGDYFYLCYGNRGIKLFGRITSEALQLESKTQGWLYRSYEVVAYSKDENYKYNKSQKGWTPNYNSTLWNVPKNEYREFEEEILMPLFDINLNELEELESSNNKDIHNDSSKEYTKEQFLKEVFISEQQYNDMEYVLRKKKNLILQGAPGVGKTFAAKRLAYSMMGVIDESRIEMVQFHQNYSYEDFVMGFRPTESGGFSLKNGIFYEFNQRAIDNPDKNYYFIIDEINRGNLSKIFGELLMLIEIDKRDPKFAIPLTYKSNTRFYVPENLFIIGMMNTADRSLAIIDYALRRRFSFIEIDPAFNRESFKKHLFDNGAEKNLIEKIIQRLNYLNNEISSDINLGKGFRVGHSYFCNPSIDSMWYENIIKYEINPLIEEYWFDNEEKAKEYMKYLLR